MVEGHGKPGSAQKRIERAPRSDRVALEELLLKNLPRLRAFVRERASARILQRETCADVVQSVCREVLENRGGRKFPREARFRSWLFTVALRRLRKHQCIGGEDPQSLDPDAVCSDAFSPLLEAVASETLEHVGSAFAELLQDFMLSRIMESSHAEIAERIPGATAGAVHTRRGETIRPAR